jgi:hypothetical protein
MPNALARATPALQEHQGALRQIGYQLIQRLHEFQHPQNPQQHDEVSAVSRLDALDRTLGDPGFFGQPGLREPRVDATTLQALTDLLQNRLICKFGCDLHNSSLETNIITSRRILLVAYYGDYMQLS